MMFATLYSHKGHSFLGRWHSGRAEMMAARVHELFLEPNTKVVATIVAQPKESRGK